MMIVKPKAPPQVQVIKDSIYTTKLIEVKTFVNSFGDRLGFIFAIQGGEYDGVELMRSCSPQLSRQGKLAELLQGILGRELTVQELEHGFDLESLIGSECELLVLQKKARNGQMYSNIEKVFSI